ncbi:MAG: type II toxin-antitoxin system VapC family toxin [Anaerolineales bacterium]
MYLVDTNVWLELLLDQAKADEARQFFQGMESTSLAITEFSLYSLGVILTKLKKDDVFEDFLSDAIEDSGVMRIRLETSDLKEILAVRRRSRLDFDDAYQYVAAGKFGFTLVSFDSDFDPTELGRKQPSEV